MDTNYFVCTLGQAAALKQDKHREDFSTINDFIDLQAKSLPHAPAVGIPRPSFNGDPYESWEENIIISKAVEDLKDGTGVGLNAVPLPKQWACHDRLELLRNPTDHVFEFTPYWAMSKDDVAYLHHTSGTSSGLPKPIPQTHHAAIGVLPYLSNGSDKATFTTTPLYHGGIADLFRAWTSGAMVWMFPGKEVPITARNILKSMDCATNSIQKVRTPEVKYFSSVPYVLQMMASDTDGLKILTEMEIVGVGGAALPASVGDDLVKSRVNLVSRFGSAECGFLLSSHRDYDNDQDWQYLRSAHGSRFMKFESQGSGTFELVILPGWPYLAKTNRPDGSLATADLFVPHRHIPDAWKYHSRSDSQLTLITGKKFDPAPQEAAIATSPLVADALIFGNGKPYPGALLFRSEKATNICDLDLIESIWPEIERLNIESQDHSRVAKPMLVVIPSGRKGLEKSSKGTVLRGQAEKTFAHEIENAYTKMSGGQSNHQKNGVATRQVPDNEVPHAILAIIKSVTGDRGPLAEDADFFSYGIDSVACMQIRTLLNQKLLPTLVESLPLNIVYDCETIKGLSRYVLDRRHGRKADQEDETQLMLDLVKEYSKFEVSQPISTLQSYQVPQEGHSGECDVVVLTGATGALGAHLLDSFRTCNAVSHIYCLVRASDDTAARERVNKSLLRRGKSPLSSSSSQGRISCVIAKLGAYKLGLSDEVYESIARQATLIVHAAWAVNFSMRLRSFVKDHIAGIHNLLHLALSSSRPTPPNFLFCSSTASVTCPPSTSPIPESISQNPASASPLGYSRSKWVAESICAAACRDTRLQGYIKVLRIGQLCGDTENGIWNTTEAWPLMLDSVRVMGTLPLLDESLSWLPVNIAANAVSEIAFTTPQSLTPADTDPPVYHILNKDTTSKWTHLLSWLRSLRIHFETIPPQQWVDQLEHLRGDAAKHPARKLVGLWKEAYCGNNNKQIDNEKLEPKQSLVSSTENAEKVSSAMRDIQPINEQQFAKMWRWIQSEIANSEGV
ncbi:MAG: putative secondary metabolism biosynthetic enzyme [Candelaria pacifica]|nr:MAG: putative secondary metabolism biosynthetic enzyme [Candelaria pacifica]